MSAPSKAPFPEAETVLASTIDPEPGEPPASAIELHLLKPARGPATNDQSPPRRRKDLAKMSDERG
jgi:hypothetical protein